MVEAMVLAGNVGVSTGIFSTPEFLWFLIGVVVGFIVHGKYVK